MDAPSADGKVQHVVQHELLQSKVDSRAMLSSGNEQLQGNGFQCMLIKNVSAALGATVSESACSALVLLVKMSLWQTRGSQKLQAATCQSALNAVPGIHCKSFD